MIKIMKLQFKILSFIKILGRINNLMKIRALQRLGLLNSPIFQLRKDSVQLKFQQLLLKKTKREQVQLDRQREWKELWKTKTNN